MKRLACLLAIAAPFCCGEALDAAACGLAPAPAATLLLPYFEVGDGTTTFFSVNNADPEPALTEITLWTDWGAPSVYFHVFLTGFDSIRINLAEVFDGKIPITADQQSDPLDEISPSQGVFSSNPEWDGSFPGCEKIFPFFQNPVIAGAALDRMTNGHTGQPVASLDGACLGADHGDDIARGYVTVDVVRRCDLRVPGSEGYFSFDDSGVADQRDVLFGDFYVVDTDEGTAVADTLVHLQTIDPTESESGATFYSRFAPDGADQREPLGTVWGVPVFQGAATETDLLVWRDPTSLGDDPLVGSTCSASGAEDPGPDWFPLNEAEITAFNESEDAVGICSFVPETAIPAPPGDPFCFPYATGRYRWGQAPLDAPFAFGWVALNLNLPEDDDVGDPDVDLPTVSGGQLSQSYVSVLHRVPGLFAVGLSASPLEGACTLADPRLQDDFTIPHF